MNDFDFSVTSGKVTITGYRGKGGDVVVPDTIDGLPVTTIGYRAFAGCPKAFVIRKKGDE